MSAAGRPPTTFGELVKQLRLDRGWSQTTLANEAGLSGGYISLIETGRRGASPSPRTLRRLVVALACDPVELFTAAGRVLSPAEAARLRATIENTPEVIRVIEADPLLGPDERDELVRRYRRYIKGRR